MGVPPRASSTPSAATVVVLAVPPFWLPIATTFMSWEIASSLKAVTLEVPACWLSGIGYDAGFRSFPHGVQRPGRFGARSKANPRGAVIRRVVCGRIVLSFARHGMVGNAARNR